MNKLINATKNLEITSYVNGNMAFTLPTYMECLFTLLKQIVRFIWVYLLDTDKRLMLNQLL